MKNIGLSFEIPNKYGTYLSEILEPLPYANFHWLIDDVEIYKILDGELLGGELFRDRDKALSGNELYKIAASCSQYLIFITLRAFHKTENMMPVMSFQEFMMSDCQILLGVYDCSEVMFWCKDSNLISRMCDYIQEKGYKNLQHITEDELIGGKYRIV